MPRYLVTGVAGFIGSTLAHAVLAQGGEWWASTIFTGNHENLAGVLDRIEFHEADLLDLDALHQACRGVIMFARSGHPFRPSVREGSAGE